MDKFIIRNALQCLNCNDIIESKHRHDFIKCSCEGCFIDGGLDYLRRGCRKNVDYVDLTLYSTNPHWAIRPYVFRYGYGKVGNPDYGIYRVTCLTEMTDEHLNALLTYCNSDNKWLPIYKNEIKFRKQNNIKINE